MPTGRPGCQCWWPCLRGLIPQPGVRCWPSRLAMATSRCRAVAASSWPARGRTLHAATWRVWRCWSARAGTCSSSGLPPSNAQRALISQSSMHAARRHPAGWLRPVAPLMSRFRHSSGRYRRTLPAATRCCSNTRWSTDSSPDRWTRSCRKCRATTSSFAATCSTPKRWPGRSFTKSSSSPACSAVAWRRATATIWKCSTTSVMHASTTCCGAWHTAAPMRPPACAVPGLCNGWVAC